MTVPLPPDEVERLQAVHDYGLMDTPPEAVFDEIVALASFVFQAPIALVSLLDESRQWFKARIGIDIPETPREHAFCSHTILDPEGMVVPDALSDPRFATNPLVLENPGIRFYAGTPLVTREGYALGALCVVDTKPRQNFDSEQKRALQTLGRHLMSQIEVRYSSAFLAKALMERRQVELAQQNRILEHGRELSRLNEMKDRFMAMLAHELRNPLASILNAIELLRSPEPDDAVEVIEYQTKNLSRLVEDLLDLSRVTRGKITLKKVAREMGEALRAAARAIRPAFEKRQQLFAVELPKEPLWVRVDPVRLEQIVSNLLMNASKFTEAGREISLSLQSEGGHAVVRVRDEGIGIPPEMRERIFEPFVQVAESHSQNGLGLGLPLVRQLVRLHNGTVEVQSEGVGGGSEFIVRLPLIDAPAATPAAQAAVETESGQATARPSVGRRVLVVEDNPDLGSTLSRLIARWGYEVTLVASGSDALEKALEVIPDIAIVDIGLPEMDGFAVAECLHSVPELLGMRLIAMSGYGEEADRARAAHAGFHDFLLKPVEPTHLRNLLEGAPG